MLKFKIGEWRRDLYSPNHRAELSAELGGMPFVQKVTVPELATEAQREQAIEVGVATFQERLMALRDDLVKHLGPVRFVDRMQQRSDGIDEDGSEFRYKLEKRDDGE